MGFKSCVAARLTFVTSLVASQIRIRIILIFCFKVMLGQGDVVYDHVLNCWWNRPVYHWAAPSSYRSIISLSHLLFLECVDNLCLLSILSIIHIKMIAYHFSLFSRKPSFTILLILLDLDYLLLCGN